MLGQRARGAVLALAVAAMLLAPGAAAQGWPQFRGNPEKTGIATDSAPASDRGWTFESIGGGQIVASPVSDGVQVLVAEYSGSLAAVDIGDGSLLWSHPLGAVVTATPAIDGDLILVATGKRLVAIEGGEQGSPRERWSFETPARIDCAPTVAGGAVFVGSDDRKMYKVDLQTGAALWNYSTGDVVKSSPAVVGSVVYFGSYDGYLYALQDGGSSASLLWRYDAQGEIQGAPAFAGGTVFATTLNGRVVAVNASSGARAWEASPGGVITSSPAVAGSRLVVGGDTLAALSLENGAAQWERPLAGYIRGSPAVTDEVVIVGDYGGKVFAHFFNGTLAWSFDAGAAIRTSPAIAGGLAIVGTDAGRMIGVPLAAGEAPSVQALAPRSTYAGVVETFAAVASDPEGRGVFYTWDFGDGTSAMGQSARHAYAGEGNYTLTLTASDGEKSRSVSAMVTVHAFASTVTGGVSPTPPSGGPFSALVLIGAAVAAAGGLLLFVARRSRAPREPPPPAPYGPPTTWSPPARGNAPPPVRTSATPAPPPPAITPPARVPSAPPRQPPAKNPAPSGSPPHRSARPSPPPPPTQAPVDAQRQAELDYYARRYGAPPQVPTQGAPSARRPPRKPQP